MTPRRHGERGSALLLAIALILAITLIGAAIIRLAGRDRTEAAKLGTKDRGRICAEAGLQYGRRFFGMNYEASHNWNDYLTDAAAARGFRFDPSLGDVEPADLSAFDLRVRGALDGATLEPGADLGSNGPSFWVSIRDDDDERPLGAADDRRRDNNENVILRSECTNPNWAIEVGGRRTAAVVEAVLTHIQGASGYGNAQITSNSPDVVGFGGTP